MKSRPVYMYLLEERSMYPTGQIDAAPPPPSSFMTLLRVVGSGPLVSDRINVCRRQRNADSATETAGE